MKLNPIQIAASAVGAVLAAVIASFFGVQGTIVGVLVGSIVASTGSVLVFQSLERTHRAVRQVVADPRRASLFRGRGSTAAAGSVTARRQELGPGLGAGVLPEEGGTAAGAGRVEHHGSGAGAGPVDGADATSGRRVPPERRLVARSGPGNRAAGRPVGPAAASDRTAGAVAGHLPPRRRIRWPALVATTVLVVVAAFAVVTAIELAAGETLSTLLGVHGAKGSTSIGSIVSPTPTTTRPTSSTTTTTTASTTTTTTTTTTTSSTTTTSPGSAPGSTSTTLPRTTTTAPAPRS
ncbi:MAG TPA: hypothetical protein VKV36_06060 [Acidimicrobiales bacterium]|nr:hypothetical protein [Acidimicrobiales bacterium]